MMMASRSSIPSAPVPGEARTHPGRGDQRAVVQAPFDPRVVSARGIEPDDVLP